MYLPADDPGRPPHQSPRHAFACGNRAASPTLANRPELLSLSSLLPYCSLPAARLPNNHASLVGGNFTLNVSGTWCSAPSSARLSKKPHESLHHCHSIFCQIACQKTGRPASFDHRSRHLTGIRQWMNHAVKGKAAASFAQTIPPPEAWRQRLPIPSKNTAALSVPGARCYDSHLICNHAATLPDR